MRYLVSILLLLLMTSGLFGQESAFQGIGYSTLTGTDGGVNGTYYSGGLNFKVKGKGAVTVISPAWGTYHDFDGSEMFTVTTGLMVKYNKRIDTVDVYAYAGGLTIASYLLDINAGTSVGAGFDSRVTSGVTVGAEVNYFIQITDSPFYENKLDADVNVKFWF